MKNEKDLTIEILKICQANSLQGKPTDSYDVEIVDHNSIEICLVFRQLFDAKYLAGNDFTSFNTNKAQIHVIHLTAEGDIFLKKLLAEKEAKTLLGWLKKNWFVLITLILSIINLVYNIFLKK